MPLHRIGFRLVDWLCTLFRHEPPLVARSLAAWVAEFGRAVGASHRFDTLRRERATRDALGIDLDGVARQIFAEYYAGPHGARDADGVETTRPVTVRTPGESSRAPRSFPPAGRAPSVR